MKGIRLMEGQKKEGLKESNLPDEGWNGVYEGSERAEEFRGKKMRRKY